MDLHYPNRLLRTRAAFYGLAVCDALGAPLEFQQRPKTTTEYLLDVVPNRNFSLPAGHFTDDTSMALCLAMSLAISQGQHDAINQAGRYVMWLDEGYMSSVPGRAFDVGNQTRQVLQYWRKTPSLETQRNINEKFNDEWCCGNGSLMRVLPCALIAKNEHEAATLGRKSSEVTHPHIRCLDACALYSKLALDALNGASKEQLIERVTMFIADDKVDNQLRIRLLSYDSIEAFITKSRDQISSSGYVLDSLEAALWSFFSTQTFEEGAIQVVNLGDDADTVGAIYGGLAGAYYGAVEAIPDRWRNEMRQMHLIEDAVSKIFEYHGQQSD